MLSFRKVFIWHLGTGKWDKVMEKYETISTSFKGVHERFLAKGANHVKRRFRNKQN
jgi:hypothetical protein